MLSPTKQLPPSGLVGQDRATRILNSLLTLRRYPPLLFTGLSGVGKRTAALLYAQAANCDSEGTTPCGTCRTCRAIGSLQHPDVRLFFPARRPKKKAEETSPDEAPSAAAGELECYCLTATRPTLDPTLVIPIESVRWIRRQVARPPMSARLRVFIIIQAHRLTLEAAIALLKTIEELPVTTTTILTTDVPEDVPSTIRSRCQQVRFGTLNPEIIAAELRRRGLTPASPDGKSRPETEIAQWSGSLGAAIRLLRDSAHAAESDEEPETPVHEVAAELLNCIRSVNRYALGTAGRPEPKETAEAALALCALALRDKLNSHFRLAKHGETSNASWRMEGWTRAEMCRAMWFLLERIRESSANVHAPLALHELTAGLRACCCRE